MSFARKFRRQGHHGQQGRPAPATPAPPTPDWVVGMTEASAVEGKSEFVTVVWLQADRVLAEESVPPDGVDTALVSGFMKALLEQGGRRPGRVRVQGEGLASLLRRAMPPNISIVRAPTPELYAFLERRGGLPPGTYTQHLPAPGASFIEVPPFGRVAAEIFANLARGGHPASDVVRISCAAVGLHDAVLMHRVPPGDLPSLFIFRDYQEVRETLRGGPNDTWDQGLFHYRLSYVRDPSMTEDVREGLRAEGWWFDSSEPDLRPVGCVIDGRRGPREPSAAEHAAFIVASYATVAMLDEPMDVASHANHEMGCSFGLRLDEKRVAHVRLSWKVDLQSLGVGTLRQPN